MPEDYFFMTEFSDYRSQEVEAAAGFLKKALSGQVSPEYLNGAMAMLKTIVHLPANMAKTDEAKHRAELLTTKMMDDFVAKMARKFIMEGE
jgi:hypothetical protein